MPIVKFRLELYKKSFDELGNYAQDKVKKLEGSAYFPSCQLLVTGLKGILLIYTPLINNKTITKAEKSLRDKERAGIEDLLTRIATYCALDCADTPENFPLSGFDFAAPTSAKSNVVYDKPVKFSVELGVNPGEIVAGMEAFSKAKGFSFATTPEPVTSASTWTVIPSGKRKITISGLPSGVKIWVKGGPVNKDGSVNYSDPISRIVQ